MYTANIVELFCAKGVLCSALMDYFLQSNFAGQVIVVVLLVMSVAAWGIMFCKKADLSSMGNSNADTARKLRAAKSVLELTSAKVVRGPFGVILRDAVEAWEKTPVSAGNAARISHVENAIARATTKQSVKYEDKMVLLGTIISGAPFLGLLGTAWGVMDCFGSMSAQASVTLQNLAPGVAGALLTTVAGLLVAIPSVFGYNYLSSLAKNGLTDLDNFASLVADRIEMEAAELAAANAGASAQKNRTTQQQNTPNAPRAAAQPQAAPIDDLRAKVIDFSLDDDDNNSAAPMRDFDD